MLLPDKPQIIRLLHRYRTWERRLVTAPSNALVRRRFEDTAYTLCILMGHRTAREAVLAAERYIGSSPSPAGASHASHAPSASHVPRTVGGGEAQRRHEIRPGRRIRQD